MNKTVQTVHDTLTLEIRQFMAQLCRADSQHRVLHNDIKLALCFKLVMCTQIFNYIVDGLQLIQVFSSIGSRPLSNVSHVEVHTPRATIRINMFYRFFPYQTQRWRGSIGPVKNTSLKRHTHGSTCRLFDDLAPRQLR